MAAKYGGSVMRAAAESEGNVAPVADARAAVPVDLIIAFASMNLQTHSTAPSQSDGKELGKVALVATALWRLLVWK